MEIRTEKVEGLHCVFLKGRMDVAGTQEVDLKFTALTATPKLPVMVDLSEVDFISSMGVRLLLTNAKNLLAVGAPMVLVKPRPIVLDALRFSGIDQLIPIVESHQEAATILRPAVQGQKGGSNWS